MDCILWFVLVISGLYHDSAALIKDGKIVFVAYEGNDVVIELLRLFRDGYVCGRPGDVYC